jgi:hypothetical protein
MLFYDKKWRDSGADTRHQSLPTALAFSLFSPTTAQTALRTHSPQISITTLKKLPCHPYFYQNILNTKITYFPSHFQNVVLNPDVAF